MKKNFISRVHSYIEILAFDIVEPAWFVRVGE